MRDHHGELQAVVNQSVAIRAGTPNYVNAWNFIKLLLTDTVQCPGGIGSLQALGLGRGRPVNMVANDRQIGWALSQSLPVGEGAYWTNEGEVYHPVLTMEQKQPVIDMFWGVTRATLPNQTVGNLYLEAMAPFFAGEVGLDEAMETLRRRLSLYLSE